MQDKKKVEILRSKFEALLTSPKKTSDKMGHGTAMLIARVWNDFCAEAKIDHFKMVDNRDDSKHRDDDKGPHSLKFVLTKEEMVDKLKSSGFSSFEIKDGAMHDMINEQVDLVHKQLGVCNDAFADIHLKDSIDRKISNANAWIVCSSLLTLLGLCVIAGAVALILTLGPTVPALMTYGLFGGLLGGEGVAIAIGGTVGLVHSVKEKNEIVELIGKDIDIKQVTTLLDDAKSMLTLAEAFSKNVEAKKEPSIDR